MRRVGAVLALALAACGGPEPRYGEATVSSEAPQATLSGTTFGRAAAMELAPGCPGYLDAETPGHVVHVEDALSFTVQARSDEGPLALAVARGDEVRCDSDDGSGHAPSLDFEAPGEYQVYVASLRAPAELGYELTVRGAGGTPADASAVSAGEVSVTITSRPAGATVTDAAGREVGTTPAMFVVARPEDEDGRERTWTLSLEGHRDTEVTGTLDGGALVLHGHLPTLGPTHVEVSASESQPVRDYRSAVLAVDVAEDCPITDAEVEVDIQHTFRGDLRVVLGTPWGDDVTLHRHGGGGRRNLRTTYDLSDRGGALRALLGHSTRGRWSLTVHDDAGADEGSFDRFDLRLTCAPEVASADDGDTDDGDDDADDDDRRVARRQRPRPRPRQPRLPDLPTRADIVRVLGALRPQVERCGTQGGSVRVIATVVGSTGRVRSVSSSGTASDGERRCVERVVRTARFGRFRRSVLDVDHTYDLPARSQGAQGGGQVLSPWQSP
ncbi:MAG TPA: proprotein convertase P-domain-containing protein [Sandaracinaceae bacterium LLY-WYZ-13_1]|nr:proprotein convertase P-domain-containing protein [Sandaracinaceae bacterium LLY-WYZ-13_1]